MKKDSIFIRILCVISILPIGIALLYNIMFLFDKYWDKYDPWQTLYYSQPVISVSVPSDWAYTEGKGELYFTSALMNENGFEIYLSSVIEDSKNESLFHNQYLGDLNNFKVQCDIIDFWKDFSMGVAEFEHQGKSQKRAYVSLSTYNEHFYLLNWDREIEQDILEHIGTRSYDKY